MLSKTASSTTFWVFGMTQPGIESHSPGPLTNIIRKNLGSYLGHFSIWVMHLKYSKKIKQFTVQSATEVLLCAEHYYLVTQILYIYLLNLSATSQFFKWSLTGFLNSMFSFSSTSCHVQVWAQSAQLFTYSWRENSWIHTFLKGICIMWNANCLVQDLKSGHCVYFLLWKHPTFPTRVPPENSNSLYNWSMKYLLWKYHCGLLIEWESQHFCWPSSINI